MLKLFQTGRAHMAVLTQPDVAAERTEEFIRHQQQRLKVRTLRGITLPMM
jgi:hypothetical protein